MDMTVYGTTTIILCTVMQIVGLLNKGRCHGNQF